MKKIILDTNALMAIAELKIDLFEELKRACDFPYQLSILDGTVLELQKIMREQKGKAGQAAKLALALVKAKKVSLLKSEEVSVDDGLVRRSQQGDLVLTQDIVLKERLVKPYLTIRQKKRIIMVI